MAKLIRGWTLGVVAALLWAAPALAEPKVVTLGSEAGDDPAVACASLAGSPFEDGGLGVAADSDVFIDGALAACEAAIAADPASAEASTRLARVYIITGRVTEAAPMLEHAADTGNLFAAYLLDTILDGTFPNELGGDPERALAYLQQASDGGFPPAETALAKRYEIGDGVDEDMGTALQLYGMASEGGDGAATSKLGELYRFGTGVDQDFARAMELFQQAAEQGEPLGYNGIGDLYQNGEGVDVDYAKAAEAYQHGADRGEPRAQTSLAYLYEQGLGIEQSYDTSFALLSAAVGKGNGFAEAALAIHYLFGQGTPVDAKKALALASAVTEEVNYANGIVGYMYAEGLGTDRDLNTAIYYYQQGADGGDDYAKSRLPVAQTEQQCQDAAGSPYEVGGGEHGAEFEAIDAETAIAACKDAVDANPEQVGDKVWLARAYIKAGQYDDALPLLNAGIDADNVLAETLAAELLLTGEGAQQDVPTAIEYYTSAAETFAPAQFALGQIYAEGTGIDADIPTALAWYRKALESGYDGADAAIADLSGTPPLPVDADLDTGLGREGPVL